MYTRGMIEGKDMRDALASVVQRAGADYVYKGLCWYIEGTTPRCGVGQALAELGVSNAVLQAMDCAAGGSKIRDVQVQGLNISFEARAIAVAFQIRQDVGVKWGKCLESAIDTFNMLCWTEQ